MNRELPAIARSAYASNAVDMGRAIQNQMAGHNLGRAIGGDFSNQAQFANLAPHQLAQEAAQLTRYQAALNLQPIKERKPAMPTRRLVQVIIADPDENVPLEQCLLYQSDQKLTDATDQELFFEVDIKSLLDKHNERRVKLVDKSAKDRSAVVITYLEPARIRDLKMVVVTVATF